MLFRGRRIVAGVLLLAALTFTGIRQVRAQGQPPDLQMLLNLDLFSSPGSDHSQAAAPGDSMLDQIRALRQMGYLGENAENAQDQPYGAGAIDTLIPWLFAPLEKGQGQ
jgi:hypothetical protein